jgi:arylsulfatase A-like enzyme
VVIGAVGLVPSYGKNTGNPNIVYILADDLGYGDLGCYGQQEIRTPNIDTLCREGMKFTNHHSGSTVCAPSRSCLLNGRHTGHVWVRANGNFQMREDAQDITIARVLKNAGYHTAMIGKSGTGCDTDPGHANRKGFDYFYGFNGHGAAHHYFPTEVYRNDQKIVFPNNKKHTGDTYIHDEFMKEIMTYLDERGQGAQPFFLHYAAIIPHASLVAPEEWVAQYRGKVKEEKQGPRGGYAQCDEPKATFAGMVSRLDWEVGKIMEKLEALGIADNTLVVFASDNGPHSAGGNKAEWFNSNGELRGEKRDLFEGGVRVPMIAHWPGKIKAASESDHLSAFWDVMPTLCELTGAKAPMNIDGISFLPTLLGQGVQRQHDYLYWEFYEKGGKRAALTHKWKAVQPNMNKGGDPIMLFDIASDLSEENDVASAHPEVVRQFEALFKEAHDPSPIVSWKGKKGK